ncbi:hypothetical protein BDY21DRAFT_417479 [Lineolata rhizophorae]|uniref:P-loop containing nucleoside triphosphate hydrolase protein n=1 Tax=Lineolata rhizophorae TaxID=578093 RepID=A0A6A6NMK8_9PEZI|nr:hypothetical protein BDY21DRAFT_417479 [Lineolata rhizophorae]
MSKRVCRRSESASESKPLGPRVVAEGSNPIVDIVFVHGLTGHRDKTWTAEMRETPWPEELLSQDIRDARIVTYGYDTDVVYWTRPAGQNILREYATNLVDDLASLRTPDAVGRPIFFVAHSLGGIVCQDAILTCENRADSARPDILDSLRGVIFLGTPHVGPDLTKFAAAVVATVRLTAAERPNPRLLEALLKESPAFANIESNFLMLVRTRVENGGLPIKLHCFVEEFPVAGQRLVTPESAALQGHTWGSIQANHKEMTKFSFRDHNYSRVLLVLRSWCRDLRGSSGRPENAQSATNPSPEMDDGDEYDTQLHPNFRFPTGMTQAHNPCHYVPLPRNRQFSGRHTQLDELELQLQAEGYCQRIALVGLGGVGKTQIALDYSVFWVSAASSESFEQAMVGIARALGIPLPADQNADAKELVRQSLSQQKAGQWLLILDNADDTKQISAWVNYLPKSHQGSILFTTRSQNAAISLAGTQVIEVNEMKEDVALELLRKHLIKKDLLNSDQTASDLLRELTFLPLAIMPISRYLELLRRAESEKIAATSKSPVATTWLVSFDQIRRDDELAAEYLSFMAVLEPKMIPESILPRESPEERMIHAIGTLKGYSFITEHDGGTSYDMHRLVHLAMRNWLQEQDRFEKHVERVIKHVAINFPDTDYMNRPSWSKYLPHVQKILAEDTGKNLVEQYLLFHNAACCMCLEGRLRIAEEFFSIAYNWKRQNLGVRNRSTLESAMWLGSSYQANGKVERAGRRSQKTIQID